MTLPSTTSSALAYDAADAAREVVLLVWLRGVLATLAGWGVALILVIVGERCAASLLPPAVGLPTAPTEQAQVPAPRPPEEAAADREPLASRTLVSEPSPVRRLVVAEPGVANLRTEPTTTSAIIAILPQGTLVDEWPSGVEVEAVSPGWRRVRWNGHEGWMWADLLQPAGAAP